MCVPDIYPIYPKLIIVILAFHNNYHLPFVCGVMFYLELCATVSRLTQERDIAQQDATDLREGMDDLQDMFDDEKSKLLEKLKKELAAKDRQIESLEEQLRYATRIEIKKLKRGTTALCARHVPPFGFSCLLLIYLHSYLFNVICVADFSGNTDKLER